MILRGVTLGTLTLMASLAACATVRAQERMGPIAAENMTAAQKKAIADYKINGEQLFYPNANDSGA